MCLHAFSACNHCTHPLTNPTLYRPCPFYSARLGCQSRSGQLRIPIVSPGVVCAACAANPRPVFGRAPAMRDVDGREWVYEGGGGEGGRG
ncbi:hypothetical protein B0A54_15795, partial [Friedmanniomyces endolithicus]